MQMGLRAELVLVNDEPGNKLPVREGKNNWGEIVVCNQEENQGIHGARQSGVRLARGRYVVFLDQDDKIYGNYLVSQRKKIEDNDAVICNGYRTEYGMDVKWRIYAFPEEHHKAVVLENYLCEGNQIISPGQVLFVKDAMPEIWMSKVMKSNGADDFLLWVLMLFQERRFALNAEYLYEHIGHEGNVSNQTSLMDDSIKESIRIMQEYAGYFGIHREQLEEIELWRKKKKEMEEERAKKRSDKSERLSELFEHWAYLRTLGISFADFFLGRGVRRLVIYGLGYIGGRLFQELKDTDVDVVCGIDRLANRMYMEKLPIVALDDDKAMKYIHQADAIIITVVHGFSQIRETIEANYKERIIYSFEEIIHEIVEEVKKLTDKREQF